MGEIREITASDYGREVLESELPTVVDFYSTECAPCEALAPKLDGLAALYGEHVKVVKIFRQGARAISEELGVRSSPTLLFYQAGQEVAERLTGAIHRSAIMARLDAMVGPEVAREVAGAQRPRTTHTDLLVVGGGPAGLTAGIYAAQAKLDVIVVDAGLGGGNLAITHQISNFPGFPEPQPGYLLAHRMVEQAKAAGVKLRLAADVGDIDLHELSLTVDGLETLVGKKLLVATGSSPRPIGVKGEREYTGKGISYCATCDAKYYDGKHVVVIGGGNSAVEEALFITRFAEKITIVHQLAELTATQSAREQARANPKIQLLLEHEPREFRHDGRTVSSVLVEDLRTGEERPLACDGVFIFAGMRPNLDAFGGAFALDASGYVRVDDEMRTSVPNVFAAGDIVSKRYRQMTTAIADGTVASIAAARELAA